jgi:hypothetical protein
MFQYTGAGEVGIGPGVEREIFEEMSRTMVFTEDAEGVHGTSSADVQSGRRKSEDENAGQGHKPMKIFKCVSDTQMYLPIYTSDCSVDGSEVGGVREVVGAKSTRQEHESFGHTIRGHVFRGFGMLIGHFLMRAINASVETETLDSATRDSLSTADGFDAVDIERDVHSTSLSSSLAFTVCEPFWKLVMKQKLTIDDLEGVDHALYQNLMWLLAYDGDVEDLDLTFSVTEHVADDVVSNSNTNGSSTRAVAPRIKPLTPDGAATAVTKKNRKKYLALMVEHALVHRMQTQATAVREGVEEIVPEFIMDLFTASDLALIVAGESTINVDDWQKQTAYEGYTYSADTDSIGADIDSPGVGSGSLAVVKWFWKFIRSLRQHERSLLLRFATGSSRLPVGGFAALKPRFTIAKLPFNSRKALPTAATCFNMLKLPAYDSEQSLRKHLMTAIVHGSEGFAYS